MKGEKDINIVIQKPYNQDLTLKKDEKEEIVTRIARKFRN